MPVPSDDEVLTALHTLRDAQDARVAAEANLTAAQDAVTAAEANYRNAASAFQSLVNPEGG